MAKSSYFQALLLTATVFSLSACGSHPPAQNTAQAQYGTDDASINANVQNAVTSVHGVHADRINVSTQNAVVTLRGTTDDQLSAQNALQAARQVPGVKTVDYDIKFNQ